MEGGPERKRLASEGYQEAIVRRISARVQQFLGQREKLAQTEVP